MVTAKLQIINGVGPEWFPTTIRDKLTKFSLMFFDADSWEHHDEAYTKGGGLYSKFKADFIFLFEMLASASKKKVPCDSCRVLSSLGLLFIGIYVW